MPKPLKDSMAQVDTTSSLEEDSLVDPSAIPALAMQFMQKAERKHLPKRILSRDAIIALQAQAWPGGVKELERTVYRLCLESPAEVIDEQTVEKVITGKQPDDQPDSIESMIQRSLRQFFDSHENYPPTAGLYARLLPLLEKPLLEETLRYTGDNKRNAAIILGINRNTLHKKLQRYGIIPGRRTRGEGS